MKVLCPLFGVLVVLASLNKANASGRSFAVACGQLLGQITSGECTVMIHSYTDTVVRVRDADNPTGFAYNVLPGQVTYHEIVGYDRVVEGIESKTVYINSEEDIEVHVSNTGSAGTYSIIDAVELIPEHANDTEFYLANLGTEDSEFGCTGHTTFYSVAAFSGSTDVTIHRREEGELIEISAFTLEEFEVYTNRTAVYSSVEENFSGYVVRSSSPVSVFTGNRCYNHNSYSHATWSSIPSVQHLGLSHVTYNVEANPRHYFVKVVATQDGTEVVNSLGNSATIDQAEVADFVYDGSAMSMFNCSNPCVVMQMINGSSSDSGLAQNIVFPTTGMITKGMFTTPPVANSGVYEAHVLHIIHASLTGQGITVNGISMNSEDWQPIEPGYSYLKYPLAYGDTYDVESRTEPFLAMVTGVESQNRGYMFNVDHGIGVLSPTPEPTAEPDGPTPQHRIVLTGDFTSSTGENFTEECSQDYQQELFVKSLSVMADANNLIGNTLCIGKDQNDVKIQTLTTSFSPDGNQGSNVITYYLAISSFQSAAEVEACVLEITEWLIPHENWGEPILPTIPGCPGVEYTANEWNHDGNQWVCFDQQTSGTGKPGTYAVSLAYGLTMYGQFYTGSEEDLTVECRDIYTEDFLAKTLAESIRVNALIGTTLCPGTDMQIDNAGVTLNSYQSQGETSQDYSFSLSGDIFLSQVTDCVNEVSQYLSDHNNWQLPIIETDPPCPAIIFDPEEFTEQNQQWLCRESS